MVKFKTQFNFDNVCSIAGTEVVDVDKKSGEKLKVSGRRYTYKVEYDKQGKRHLVISGTEDVYKSIQSFKDDTDIYKIISRYFNGDISAVDPNKGFYADLTGIPKNVHDWFNKTEQAKELYSGLPTDFKIKFGNSINEFMTSLYGNDFESKYNDYVASKNPNNISNNDNSIIKNLNDGGNKNE